MPSLFIQLTTLVGKVVSILCQWTVKPVIKAPVSLSQFIVSR